MTEKDLYLFLIQITNNKITTPQTFYDKNTCSVIKKLLEYNYIDNYLISTKRMDGSVSVAVPFSITIEGNKFIKKFDDFQSKDFPISVGVFSFQHSRFKNRRFLEF